MRKTYLPLSDEDRDYLKALSKKRTIQAQVMFKDGRGWLRDTCLTAQDRFIARYLPIAESYAKALDEAHIE